MTPPAIRVFHLADTLGPTAGAKMLSLVAPALPREIGQTVGVLNRDRTLARSLSDAGIGIVPLPTRRVFDPPGWRAVRTAVREFRPTILHAWGPRAAGFAWALRNIGPRAAIVISSADRPADGWGGRIVRRAVRSADSVVAFGPAEATRYAGDRLTVAPLAVSAASQPGDTRASLGIPADAPYLVAVGGFDADAGLIDAAWAFDVVRYTFPAARLVLVGGGPDRGKVEAFVRSVMPTDNRVIFAGVRTDVPSILAGAAGVWVTHRRGGTHVALEALAAGTPVIGYRTPDLAAVVTDEITGFLVPPGDRPALSRRALELLDDPDLRDRMGKAGQITATSQFAVPPVAAAVVSAYHAMVTTSI